MDADVRFKGRRIEHGVACRLAIFLLISSSKMLTCAATAEIWHGGRQHCGEYSSGGDKKPMQGRADIQARRLKLKN